MAAVINARDPISELLGCSCRDALDGGSKRRDRGGIVTWQLKRGTTLTLQPMENGENISEATASWAFANDVWGVKVLDVDDDRKFARVLIPGYGMCKVCADHLLPLEDVRPLSDVTGSAGGLQRLLSLIGASLTRLSLSVPPEAQSSVPLLFKTCPNMKALTVTSGSIDTNVF